MVCPFANPLYWRTDFLLIPVCANEAGPTVYVRYVSECVKLNSQLNIEKNNRIRKGPIFGS